MGIELTITTGLRCPRCGTPITIQTTGFFGGLIKQALLQSMVQRIEEHGGEVTGPCGHVWQQPAKPTTRKN